MKILRTRRAFEKWRLSVSPKKSVGFVPTMGALHSGHLSLVTKAKQNCDLIVVSLFVNPTQFGPREDFTKYPRTEKADLRLLKAAQVDAVWIPKSPAEMYPQGFDSSSTRVLPRESLTSVLEGEFRPGHFEGVALVVLKLFQLVKPSYAFFGEKDFQQLRVIESMVDDLFLPVRIVRCKTIRLKSGLAMSSRNQYLSESELQTASILHRVLRTAATPEEAKRSLRAQGFEIDYIEVWEKNLARPSSTNEGRWLAAVKLGSVRLIDNLLRKS